MNLSHVFVLFWIFVFSITLIYSGFSLLAIARIPKAGLGLRFGVGLTAFLIFVRMLTWIGAGFELALILFALLMGTWCFLRKEWALQFSDFNLKSSLGVFFVAIFFMYSSSAIWMNDPNYDHSSPPHASFGSIESGRYSNIAAYISKGNSIPILGQNYAQSILAATSTVLYPIEASVFALWVWLFLSQTFLFFGIREFCIRYFKSKRVWGIASGMIFFGGWSWSASHTLLFDSGSPLVFSGYSDAVFGVLTLIAYFTVWVEEIKDVSEKISWGRTLVIFLFFGSWFIYAPQNIFVFFVTFPVLLWKVRTKRSRLLSLVGCILFGSIFVLQGGLLTPKRFRTNSSIDGLVESSSGQMKPTFDRPGLDVLILEKESIGFQFLHRPSNRLPDKAFLHVMLSYFESLVTSIGYLFFPFLSVFLFYLSRRFQRFSEIDYFGFFVVLSLLSGFLFSFHLSAGEMKWQMSRFLIPGVCLSFILLGFAFPGNASNFSWSIVLKRQKILAIGVLAAVLVSSVQTIPGLVYRIRNTASLSQKLQVLNRLLGEDSLEKKSVVAHEEYLTR